MTPFFFGPSESPLFGSHHAPTQGARDTGVVLLPPIGQEGIRAHRALRQLALALSGARFHVLRFDYRGTGDSAGDFEDATLEDWSRDIGAASDELEDRTGVKRVSWVGLRMGAALALRAAKGRRDLDRLVLWEPIVRGRQYLADLRRLHVEFLEGELPRHKARPTPTLEALGFPMSPSLREEIEAIDLAALDSAALVPQNAKGLHVIVSREGDEEQTLRDALPRLHASATYRHIPMAQDWNSEEAVNASLVPKAAIDAVVHALGGS